MQYHPIAIIALLVLVHYSYGNNTTNSSGIIQVHVIFRHGIRTPSSFYPNDPHINNTFHPIGLAGLTKRGKFMMYKLGKTLRRMYPKLLGNYYMADKMTIRSANSARALMSVQLVLAGLWPPVGVQKWNVHLPWQPIPLHINNADEDDFLNLDDCKLLEKLNSKQNESGVIKPDKDIYDYLEHNSGMKIRNPSDVLNLYITLSSEFEYGLQLPNWTKKVFPNEMQRLASEIYENQRTNPTIATIQSGYVIKNIIEDTFSKINQTRRNFLHLYSTDSFAVGSLLNTLDVLRKETPHFGSTVLLELHKQDDEHFIKVKYIHDPLTPETATLRISNCGLEEMCPVGKFKELFEGLIPTQSYKELCNTM